MLEDVILKQNERSDDIENFVRELRSKFSDVHATIPIVLLMVPHSAQINRVYQDRMRVLGMLLGEGDRLLQSEYPLIQYLRRELKDTNIYIANPLPQLQIADQKEAIYYENDPHLNKYGQTSLGNFVLEYLHAKVLKQKIEI